jgi:hypothetical protein
MRISRWLLLVFVATALAGCVSAEELHRQDQAACASYGFHPGTNDFAACMQRESLARRYQPPPPPPPVWWGRPWGPYWWP